MPPIRAAFTIITDDHELSRIIGDRELKKQTLASLVETAGELTRLKEIVAQAINRLVQV